MTGVSGAGAVQFGVAIQLRAAGDDGVAAGEPGVAAEVFFALAFDAEMDGGGKPLTFEEHARGDGLREAVRAPGDVVGGDAYRITDLLQ